MRLAQVIVLLIVCIKPAVAGAVTTDPITETEAEIFLNHPKKETNADRFRRGLGPLPPTRRDRSNRGF
jgi:hypothetical protein